MPNAFLSTWFACFLRYSFHCVVQSLLKVLSTGVSTISFRRLFHNLKCLAVREVFLTFILKFPSLNFISLFLIKHPCKEFLPTTRARSRLFFHVHASWRRKKEPEFTPALWGKCRTSTMQLSKKYSFKFEVMNILIYTVSLNSEAVENVNQNWK